MFCFSDGLIYSDQLPATMPPGIGKIGSLNNESPIIGRECSSTSLLSKEYPAIAVGTELNCPLNLSWKKKNQFFLSNMHFLKADYYFSITGVSSKHIYATTSTVSGMTKNANKPTAGCLLQHLTTPSDIPVDQIFQIFLATTFYRGLAIINCILPEGFNCQISLFK